MEDSNSISVIIPFDSSLNNHHIDIYLQTILDQKYQNIEVIVIDNNFTKNRSKLSHNFTDEIKYISQNYDHISTAYNIGVELTQGEFVAFIDLENLWLPDKLTIQMAAFDSYPKLDAVFGYINQPIISQIRENSEYLSEKASCQFKNIPGYIPSTMLIKRQAWEQVGKFPKSFSIWHRKAVKLQLIMLMLPIIVAKRQIELSPYGKDSDRAASEYAKLLKATMKSKDLGIRDS
ncbi:glycosyltransferase family A protein [Merismopedia glauca]|uniref:Glycosyltransferase 2-like domain-containing protein n=1 Tax=Merismopedia glauca CCAP 1448/3 TaxID=1296344 RepID=A0A2T1C1W1_9CYAN|nr:glycosyltransferase family A protein [Merismopedia glauca]PSB02251.1 hypothetical protein C7B64_14065 [Merismopedia glauca CCAP 1448/3]